MKKGQLPSSFRDPAGYMFEYGDKVYRHVDAISDYNELMSTGLYDTLCKKKWLVTHTEVRDPRQRSDTQSMTLMPEQIPYISYPYEWCFSQIRDAALLTLDVQLEAMKHGMTLKDASAFNIQFLRARPIFIDTLSFTKYEPDVPWVAYKQFCQHFLAPLALIQYCDFRLANLFRSYIDGLPIDLASQLLPTKTWLRYGLLAHIHLHAMSQKKYQDTKSEKRALKTAAIRKVNLAALINSLRSCVAKRTWKLSDTEWGSYYKDTNYTDAAMLHKESLVGQYLERRAAPSGSVLADFGSNTGRFSRIAARAGFNVLSHDIDSVAVELNYLETKASDETAILPLLLDITNPSPGLGWASAERSSFLRRQNIDMGLALALVHHLAISNNTPLEKIAELFAMCCKSLVVEFIPKSDSQVRRLLATRQDVFSNYHQQGFEQAFSDFFSIEEQTKIECSDRTLYLMNRI